jgi:hypothetical protein
MQGMRKPKTVTTPEVRLRSRRFLIYSLLQAFSLTSLLCLSSSAEQAGGRKPVKPYALIYGTVWGPDGRPLYGVPIKIQRGGRRAHWQLSSDHSGEFAQRVPAGQADYTVVADLKGYKYPGGKHLRQDRPVTVHIENDERADIALHLIQ